MLTKKQVQTLDKYWRPTADGRIRFAYDEDGNCHFFDIHGLLSYLSERARVSDAYKREFEELDIPLIWLKQACLVYPQAHIPENERYLHHKHLAQQTAAKLRGNE